MLDSGKIDINSESTIEMFTEDYFKKSIGIIFMISLISPAIRKLLNNNILSFIVIGIISFIWIVTKWFFYTIPNICFANLISTFVLLMQFKFSSFK